MDRRKLLLALAAASAALGVALVFIYARGAETRAAERFDTVEVLTATKPISPGESVDDALEAGKVALSYVARNQLLEGASDDAERLRGKVALTSLYPGEQLIAAKFGSLEDVEAATTLPIPDGKVAISIAVKDDGRVGAFVRPGAEVAVIFTKLDLQRKPIESRLLVSRVIVLAAGTTTTDPSDQETSAEDDTELRQLLTVAVTQVEAEKIRFAEKDGELSAALLNDGSDLKTDNGINAGNLYG